VQAMSARTREDMEDGGNGRRGLRVLIVSRDELWRPSVEAWMLERTELEVSKVRGAAEMLELPDLDRYDLALVDLELDRLDGLTVGAMLREINPAMHLVLAYGERRPSIEAEARESGFTSVVAKDELAAWTPARGV